MIDKKSAPEVKLKCKTHFSTVLYCGPEMYRFNEKIDVFPLGFAFLNLLVGM